MVGFIFIFKEKKTPPNNHSEFSGVLPVQFPSGLGEQSGEMKSVLIEGKESFAITSHKSVMIFLLAQELRCVSGRDGLCSRD